MPKPDPEMKTETVFWHFARGMALAAKGKPDEAQADYRGRSRRGEEHAGRRRLRHAREQQDQRRLEDRPGCVGREDRPGEERQRQRHRTAAGSA